MSTSLQTYVDALVSRRLVEDRIRGLPAVEVETTAVLESVALVLWTRPRAAYDVWLRARSALVEAIDAELGLLTSLREVVALSTRPVYAIRDLRPLEQARLALLQVETQGNVSLESAAYRSFVRSVDAFLKTSLAPSVRAPGAAELHMTGPEALSMVRDSYASLVAQHADVLERVEALTSCLFAAASSETGAISGVVSAVRARMDLEGYVDELTADPTPASATGLASSLLAMKAALAAFGQQPDAAVVVSASRKQPAGRVLRLVSEDVQAVVSIPYEQAPLTMGAAATFQLTTSAGTWNRASFPLAGYDLADKPCLVATSVAYPVDLGAGGELYVELDGVPTRVVLGAGVVALSTILAALNASPGIYAEEVLPGRLAIVATSATSIGLAASMFSGGPVYAASAHAALGLADGVGRTAGETDPSLVRDVIAELTQDAVDVTLEEGAIKLRNPEAPSPTDQIVYTIGPYSGTVRGVTAAVRLVENGVAIPAAGLIFPGDYFTANSTAYTVSAVGDVLTVGPSLSGLNVPAEIRSGLVAEVGPVDAVIWGAFETAGTARLLKELDRALAALLGNPDAGTVAPCLSLIDSLVSALQGFRAVVASDIAAESPETESVAELLTLLRSRGLTRAYDFLLRGALREIFSMDWQTASYGGEFVAAAAAVAQADIQWPDRSRDEGYRAASTDEG